MPTLEWLKYGALGLGLALAAYSFLLVRGAVKATQLDTRRVILLVLYMLFSLALAGAGFYTDYLSKRENRFSTTYAKALLAESRINTRPDVAQKTIVFDGCLLPPSPVAANNEAELKAALDSVKASGNFDAAFKSEASKLFDINPDLVHLYALSTYCLMSKNLTQPQQKSLSDNINSIAQQVTGGNTPGKSGSAPFAPHGPTNLSEQVRSDIQLELRGLTASLAGRLNVTEERLRANVFMPGEDGSLRIVVSLRMFDPNELTIAFRPGSGATGVAFASDGLVFGFEKPRQGFFSEQGKAYPIPLHAWNQFIYPPDEAAKISEILVWVFSAPVKTDRNQVVAVVNVDCAGSGCETVTADKLAAEGERDLRIAAARIGTILQSQSKASEPTPTVAKPTEVEPVQNKSATPQRN
jgi:hypothetical protein